MKGIRLTIFAMSFAAAALCAYEASAGAGGQKGIERSATSTVKTRYDKDRGVVAEITNRRFRLVEFYADNVSSDENRRTLLLLEELKSDKGFFEEGPKEARVNVQAWIGTDPSPTKKIWAIEQDGDEGAVQERFYRVTKHGCCGAEDTSVYYNLSAGQKVFTSVSELFRIEVPNTPNSLTRYVAYTSGMASIPPPESEDPRAVIGAIEYGSEDKVIDRVLVRRTIKGIADFGTPKVEASYRQKRVRNETLELWGADKKNDPSSLSAFSMVFSFEGAGSITVPVVNDRFDVSRAIATRGFSVVRPR
ncbi:MAG TPA: hypothetical protein VEZ90_14505 [Blastocatellia bacterium]|nr:hypothetical protein [Blastocatellia bacterium]